MFGLIVTAGASTSLLVRSPYPRSASKRSGLCRVQAWRRSPDFRRRPGPRGFAPCFVRSAPL